MQQQKIKDLLDRPEKWTQGSMARDVNGMDLMDPLMPGVTSWCLLGALEHCYGYGTSQWLEKRHLLEKTVGGWVSSWNDAPERTWKEVKDLINGLDL